MIVRVGQERTPIVVIDDFYPDPERLFQYGAQLDRYASRSDDSYPGCHAKSVEAYQRFLTLVAHGEIADVFSSTQAAVVSTTSRFSRVTTPESQLSVLQSLPHVDALIDTQVAVVHYLCKTEHGGTGFYRHQETGFERLNSTRLPQYQRSLKRAVMQGRIAGGRYLRGSGQGFEQIHAIEAVWNRAIFYPSNLLHSGQIDPERDIAKSSEVGRLTLTSQINFDASN